MLETDKNMGGRENMPERDKDESSKDEVAEKTLQRWLVIVLFLLAATVIGCAIMGIT